ncbi:MAG: methyltransferase domain-containing protein [Pseudomonadota bacterium]
MHLDVGELNAFYGTPLGRTARGVIAGELSQMWPTARAERVLGLGHATPYLPPFMAEAERVCAIMPAVEGITRWPSDGPNQAALAYEDHLPLPDNSFDKVLLIHLLEVTRDPHALLREVWRVLMPQGQLIVFVPYRSGAWARTDGTPFGLGRPFSRKQLAALLSDAGLEPCAERRLLYVPPSRRRFILGSTRAWEEFGRAVLPRFAGLVAMEAKKVMVRGIPVKPRGLRFAVPGLAVPKPVGGVSASRAFEGPAKMPRHSHRVSAAERTPLARPKGSKTTRAR